jgi:hypothetical protein
MKSCGVTTSTAITGSSSTGFARLAASFSASEPAILKATSDESVSWYLPSDERRAHVHHRVAGLDARLERLLDPLLDGGDELGRHGATLDLVDEVEALAGRRLEVDVDHAVLARAAGLADELALHLLDVVADRLAVGHLRAADGRLDLELALEAIDDHLEVQLAHAGDHGLAGLLVGAHLEGRVLLAEALERHGQLLLVDLRLRLDREVHDRLGK